MKKYFRIFNISFQQEFVYRINFIMWRVRNVLQIFVVFFLWDAVFRNPQRELFGYDKARILTYIFGLIIIRAFVLSSRALDVSGEIARGELSNYLLKPVNYFKYWLTRDVSSKALNLIFAFGEAVILLIVLRPPFFLQTNPIYLVAFLISAITAMFIYFVLTFMTSSVPFWAPEAAWGASFIVNIIFVEFLSGALYPLDVFPEAMVRFLKLTPFPYLIFFPIQVY